MQAYMQISSDLKDLLSKQRIFNLLLLLIYKLID